MKLMTETMTNEFYNCKRELMQVNGKNPLYFLILNQNLIFVY